MSEKPVVFWYNQSRASEPLPSYFPRTLASPEITRRIQTEHDPVSRVMGRFGALVVMKLAAGIRSHTDSNVQISDEELACLSVILDAESRDVMFCLRWPGAVELAVEVWCALTRATPRVGHRLGPSWNALAACRN